MQGLICWNFSRKQHFFKTSTNLEIKRIGQHISTINSMLCTCPNWRGQYSFVLPCTWVQPARVWSLLLESAGRREPWQRFFLPWWESPWCGWCIGLCQPVDHIHSLTVSPTVTSKSHDSTFNSDMCFTALHPQSVKKMGCGGILFNHSFAKISTKYNLHGWKGMGWEKSEPFQKLTTTTMTATIITK